MTKRKRVLFSISQREHAENFVAVADKLNDYDVRFIGLTYWLGYAVRCRGYDYRYFPVINKEPRSREIVNLNYAEIVCRDDYIGHPTQKDRATAAALAKYIEAQVDDFCPDVVVIGNADCVICGLLQGIAIRRDIPTLSLHTTCVRDHYVVDDGVTPWESMAREADLSAEDPDSRVEEILRKGASVCTNRPARSFALSVAAFLELAFRVLIGRSSFETIKSVRSLILRRYGAQRKWFPRVPSLMSVSQIETGCVFVALHQPFDGGLLNRNDLIEFSVRCAPKGIPVVLRPHPGEAPQGCMPYLEFDFLKGRKIYISRPGVGPSLEEIFAHSKVMFTITSALGLEALLHGVRVYNLGPAFYVRNMLARWVDREESKGMCERISKENLHCVSVSEARKLLSWLCSRMIAFPAFSDSGAIKLSELIRESASSK